MGIIRSILLYTLDRSSYPLPNKNGLMVVVHHVVAFWILIIKLHHDLSVGVVFRLCVAMFIRKKCYRLDMEICNNECAKYI